MRYTVSYFKPEEHRPYPFLGQRVSLPELEGFPANTRRCLENPLLSPEQVDIFCEAMEFFSNGYDEKLKPVHWGVFTARTLEALFWRTLDISQDPKWSKGIAVPQAEKIQVYSEGMSMRNLARDLSITAFLPSLNPNAPNYLELIYPALKTERDFLGKVDEGNARVHEFWTPLYPAMIVQALAAWEATRFTDQKNEDGKPRRFDVDVALARKDGPLSAMSKLFGPSCAAGIEAIMLEERTPPSPTSSSGMRL